MALTLLLNENWDIGVDDNGNIALTTGAYAIAQNCANAIRLFTNDAYFNRTKGIPHFQIELANKPAPSRSTLTNRIRKAVMAVDGVLDTEIELVFDEKTRTYGGNVTITVEDGTNIRIEL